jgi:hypothetical protein
MRSILLTIGFCVLLLGLASSQGLSGQFCIGNQGCLVLNSAGVHLLKDKAATAPVLQQTP